MSLFVIPMAGLSSRFFRAGFSVPKYMLPLNGQSIFEWSVSSFQHYFETDQFLFILRDIYDTPAFVREQIEKMGIRHYQLVILTSETRGQADTVHLGLQQSSYHGDLTIFNIDSRRHHYIKPAWLSDCDGYLEVFRGEGEHWSFAEPISADSNHVKRTTEKERISDLCSDGLYQFKTRALFDQAFKDAITHNKLSKDELYIAPLYNYLIEQGLDVRLDCIDDAQIDFCGTPDEYQNLLQGHSTA